MKDLHQQYQSLIYKASSCVKELFILLVNKSNLY